MAHQTAVFQIGTSDPIAKQVQDLLAAAGFKPDNQKGHVTKKFLETLKKFQKACGIKVTGQADNDTLDALDLATSSQLPSLEINLNNHRYFLTKREYQVVTKRSCNQFFYGLYRDFSARSAQARAIWDHFDEMNDDQKIVSWFVARWKRPIPSQRIVKEAEKAVLDLKKSLGSNDLKKVKSMAEEAEFHVNFALDEMHRYEKEMVKGSSQILTALKFTKSAAFFTLSVLATPTPASLGFISVLKIGAASAGVTAIEGISTETGKAFAGTSKGFKAAASSVLSDSFVSFAASAFSGSKASDRFFGWFAKNGQKVVGKRVTKYVSEGTVVKYSLKYMQKSGTTALNGAVEDGLKLMQKDPKKMTWEKFFVHLGNNLYMGGFFAYIGRDFDKGTENYLKAMPSDAKNKILKGLKIARGNEDKVLAGIVGEARKQVLDKNYERILDLIVDHATGAEKPADLADKAVKKMYDKKTVDALIKTGQDMKKKGKIK